MNNNNSARTERVLRNIAFALGIVMYALFAIGYQMQVEEWLAQQQNQDSQTHKQPK